jgi:U4/U6.U5 tri-snRNP-associated protein 3
MSDRRRDEKPRDRERERDRDVHRHRESWDRDRDREKDRDRERDRRRERERKRSRSRSPSAGLDRSHRRHSHSHRGRSPSPDAGRHKRRCDASPVADDRHKEDKKVDPTAPPKVTAGGGEAAVADGDMDAEELEMMKMMGIPVGFDSTKGKYVPGADVSGVRAVTKRQPRQYMNRRGGFNRPLPPERNR